MSDCTLLLHWLISHPLWLLPPPTPPPAPSNRVKRLRLGPIQLLLDFGNQPSNANSSRIESFRKGTCTLPPSPLEIAESIWWHLGVWLSPLVPRSVSRCHPKRTSGVRPPHLRRARHLSSISLSVLSITGFPLAPSPVAPSAAAPRSIWYSLVSNQMINLLQRRARDSIKSAPHARYWMTSVSSPLCCCCWWTFITAHEPLFLALVMMRVETWQRADLISPTAGRYPPNMKYDSA